jgi:SAM-dependent methyltransferase
MSKEPQARQSELAAQKNAEFFGDNEWYKKTQSQLELYRLIANSVAHETEQSRRLLDIGNGGIFIYPIDHIPSVEAVDIFVEASFPARYPNVRWRQLSILELDYENEFDTVVVINCLHHVVGKSVKDCYANLRSSLSGIYRALQPNGKLVLLESTVPSWFLCPYKVIFPLLLRVWPLKHPPTFQFHFRDIRDVARLAGFREVEFSWVPKTGNLMTLGVEVPGWVSPIHVGKFVFRKSLEKTSQGGA